MRILMVPGSMGSGLEHWQTHWEDANPGIERVEQEEWARPQRSAWVSRLDEYLRNDPDDTILVAYSLGFGPWPEGKAILARLLQEVRS